MLCPRWPAAKEAVNFGEPAPLGVEVIPISAANLREQLLTEDEEAEALRGFPLTKRERDALLTFADGAEIRPKGMGTNTVANLLSRDWVLRTERLVDFETDRYVLTEKGKYALELDQIAVEAGYERQAATTTAKTYADLEGRRRLFDTAT